MQFQIADFGLRIKSRDCFASLAMTIFTHWVPDNGIPGSALRYEGFNLAIRVVLGYIVRQTNNNKKVEDTHYAI